MSDKTKHILLGISGVANLAASIIIILFFLNGGLKGVSK